VADSLLVVLRFQCPRSEAAEVLFKAPSASTGGFSRCPPSPRPGHRGVPSVGLRAARWVAGSSSRGMAPGSGRCAGRLRRSLGPRSWSWWRGATGASPAARCSSWSRARYGAGGCTAPPRSASPWRSGAWWGRRRPGCGGGCARRRSSGLLGRRAGRRCGVGRGTSGEGGCSRRAASTRTYSVPTLERWLYAFRSSGLDGLRPQPRSDQGFAQDLTEELRTLLLDIRREHPDLTPSDG
jgi:hypothetical protein